MKFLKLFAPFVAAALAVSAFAPSKANADAAGDKKRAQLSTVKRLLVAPLFFGTDMLGELPPPKPGTATSSRDQTDHDDDKEKEVRESYKDMLRKLEANVREQLPARSAARTGFTVVTADELTAAFKSLNLTTPEMFLSGGRLTAKKFDLPDVEKIKKLAAAVHADAILLGVMDEPRKNNGGYFFEPPAGIGYDSPKVNDKATFDLLLADGTLVLRQTVEVIHPLTHIGARQFLLQDWLETDNQIIEDLMDELTRYTPKK